MSQGKLIVISGPSGVGKGTIIKRILTHDENIALSISATTREKRTGEVDGEDYYFLTLDEFEEKIKQNAFAEYAKYSDNYYGTLCSTIDRALERNKKLILEIDVQGAFQIKEKYPSAKLIFIKPPSLEELRNRLLNRNTDSISAIKTRLSQVEREFQEADKFDTIIVNDNIEIATMGILEEIYS